MFYNNVGLDDNNSPLIDHDRFDLFIFLVFFSLLFLFFFFYQIRSNTGATGEPFQRWQKQVRYTRLPYFFLSLDRTIDRPIDRSYDSES